ncbi:MAG: hypothetical protein JXR51_05410 [Bacteroidales bacterium]|nr:hypothetical protein [Bacteroidales bacterium]
MENEKKVGFVFFEQIQHIHHFLGVAYELSKFPNVVVDILTYKNEHFYLKSLLKLINANRINLIQLNTRVDRRIIEKIKKRIIPSALFLHKKNKRRLLEYDALVFTDYNADYLMKKRAHRKRPKFIHRFHGSGGHRGHSLQEKANMFDLLLISGQKFYGRLKENNFLKNNQGKIVGLAKFDITGIESKDKQLFNNKNTTFIYNPHFSKDETSWYIDGQKVLEFFYNHEEYNLIFAPHINLFTVKRTKNTLDINEKYHNTDNIIIDTDSVNLVNMTYTLNADAYIGDVSGQLNEFLIKPRPCIFINSHQVDWKNNENYNQWRAGQVIENTNNFEEVLKKAFELQPEFEDIQKEIFADNYYIQEDKTASLRSAEAIIELL